MVKKATERITNKFKIPSLELKHKYINVIFIDKLINNKNYGPRLLEQLNF